MTKIPCFDSSQLEAVCKVLADSSRGLTGTEIGVILADIGVADNDPNNTKWRRLFNAMAGAQNEHQFGNYLIMFITRAMSPARYLGNPELFAWRQDGLNVALSFVGYAVRDDGKIIKTSPETTVHGALGRARRLQGLLKARGTHEEVFRYCTAELLAENYFHAVLESVKGIAERLRQLTGQTSDGADLVNATLATKTPVVRINSLRTDTEWSEQKGMVNLLIGLFGAVRNPTAHAPKVTWAMPEQDALDIFALISYVHRKLDGATVA